MTGSFAPYGIAKLLEDPPSGLSRKTRAALEDKWTITKVANLDTEEIVSRLGQFGIDGRRESFLPLAQGKTSAWQLGDVWFSGLRQGVSNGDDDLIHLAACELWKRYCHENPSIEMVDDWVTDGYRYEEEGKLERQLEIWARAWETVRSRWEPGMTTFESVDPIFRISQFFGNWVQDYTMSLFGLATHDAGVAETGVRVCTEILDQFVDEDENTRVNFLCDRASFLYRAGKPAEGGAALMEGMGEYPHRSGFYAVLSDELIVHGDGVADLRRAVEILERALAVPVVDADDWDLKGRLAELRRKLKSG